MNVLRVRALRWGWLLGTLACVVVAWGALEILSAAVGRRDRGPLPGALGAAATLEGQRLAGQVRGTVAAADGLLARVLGVPAVPQDEAAVPWQPGLCGLGEWPAGVVRVGLVDVERAMPLGLMDMLENRCVDRVGVLAAQAVTGPPFPGEKEVTRTSLRATWALDRAPEGATAVVAAYPEGSSAVVRLARREGGRVAMADVVLRKLGRPPAVEGARLDAVVTLGGVEVGYAHGGPRDEEVVKAVKAVKVGAARALDLGEVADRAAARAVLGWLHAERDDDDSAVAGVRESLSTPVGELGLVVVASAPLPWVWVWRGPLAAGLGLVAGLLLLLAQGLVSRRLARALRRTAVEVREAWMGLREDDVGSDEDVRRAGMLLDTLGERTRETLEAAFGTSERFWAPGTLGRLVDLLRQRLGGPPRGGPGGPR
jgi:hypothetical protein